MPWAEAVQIFGDEGSLVAFLTRAEAIRDIADKVRASTMSKYRGQGVPIQEIGEKVLERLGSGFRLAQDERPLAEVIEEVRKLYAMRRQHDWRVLLAVLDLKVSYSGGGVRAGRP